jgi:transcriptional regulator with XRE-family HTH domain
VETTRDGSLSLNDAVAEVLRAEAKARRKTLGDIEAHTHIPRVSVQRYLAGTRPIDLEKLDLLADALGLTAEETLAEARRRMERVCGAQGGNPGGEIVHIDAAGITDLTDGPSPARGHHAAAPGSRRGRR